MALIDAFPGASGTVDSTELRKNLAGLVVRNTAGVARAGIFPRNTSPLVTGRSDMKLDIAAFEGISVRGGGPLFMANDGVVQSPTLDAAPETNSRIDVLYFNQNVAASPYSDVNNLPVFGVVKGVAAASPTKPALTVAGAVELATVTIPSSATATNSSGVVITQTFQYTTTSGGLLWFRTTAERDLFAAPPGQHAYVVATNTEYVLTGSAWVTQGTQTRVWEFGRTPGSDAPFSSAMTGLCGGSAANAPAGTYRITGRTVLYAGASVIGSIFLNAGSEYGKFRWDLIGGTVPISPEVSMTYIHPGGTLGINAGYDRVSGTATCIAVGTMVRAEFLGA